MCAVDVCVWRTFYVCSTKQLHVEIEHDMNAYIRMRIEGIRKNSHQEMSKKNFVDDHKRVDDRYYLTKDRAFGSLSSAFELY